jgi:hypothetical protein
MNEKTTPLMDSILSSFRYLILEVRPDETIDPITLTVTSEMRSKLKDEDEKSKEASDRYCEFE